MSLNQIRLWDSKTDFDRVLNLFIQVSIETLHEFKTSAIFNWNKHNIAEELKFSEFLIYEIFEDRPTSEVVSSKIVAFIAFRDSFEEYEIMALGCILEEQNKKIMTSLIQGLQDRSCKASKKRIILEVHELNIKAQKVYEKLGFRRVSQRKSYYSDQKTAFIYAWVND